MLYKVSILSLIMSLYFTGQAQDVVINDTTFKTYLVNNLDINTDSNSEISISEAHTFTGKIEIKDKRISDFTGLEAFTNITSLDLGANKMDTLDLTQNTKLTFLSLVYCSKLAHLDLSKCTLLTQLTCKDNSRLFYLDLSNCINLVSLNCYDAGIRSIDLSKNTKLTFINLTRNNLDRIDISKNTLLTWISLGRNKIDTLDISNNPLLEKLHASEEYELSKFIYQKNTKLKELYLGYNKITELYPELFPALELLSINNTKLKIVDVSKNTAIEELWCNTNYDLITLYLGSPYSYKIFRAQGYLTCIEVTDVDYANSNLKRYTYGTTFFKNTCFPDLKYVDIPDPNLKAALLANDSINKDSNSQIDVGEARNYQDTIDVRGLNINSMVGLQAFTNITYLNCDSNNLSLLDISKNTELKSVKCASNKLMTLDFSKNKKLSNLICNNNNKLESLNLKNGNNVNMTLNATSNPNLVCIDVDDTAIAKSQWIKGTDVDLLAAFHTSCYTFIGIEDHEEQRFIIYPNPVKSHLTISGIKDILSITLYNNLGMKVKESTVPQINMTALTKGFYNVQIRTQNKVLNYKVQKI